ncbi:MAG: YfhO family protein [bacterium]|nr:YfhO family protein [bacterium]
MPDRFKHILFTFIDSRYFPYLLLIVLPLIIFRPTLLGTNVFALGDFSGSDLLELHLPFKAILHDAYTQGQFPLWTPYLSNGFPILAEGQSGPLYPPNILFAFLSPVLSLNYSIILVFMIAGCGMYTFSRKIPGMGKTGALCCAIVFVFGSFFVARLKHINMISVAAYLPWCLWGIRSYFVRLELKWLVLVGFIWALQILAGHPHMFYFSVIMCLWQIAGELFFVQYSVSKKDTSTTTFIILKTLTGLFIAGVLALCLAAAQLLPTLELTRLSSRQDFSYDVATAYPLRPKFLATLFAPFFLGNPATGNYRGNIQTDGIWWENVIYIGLFPLALIVVLLFFQIKRLLFKVATKRVISDYAYYYWFYTVTAILFFILSMGSYSILFSLIYYNLPGMSLFRFPTRFNLMTLLALSIMAGWAFQKLLSRLEKSRVEGSAKKDDSSDYVFSWPFSSATTTVLLFCVIIVDFGVFADQYIAYYPVQKYFSIPESVTQLRKDPYLYRIYPMTQYSQNPFGVLGWKKGEKAITSLQKAIPGNFSAVYRLFSFTDRGWFEGGLGLKERAFIENYITKNELTGGAISRILGLWNVKYVLSFNELPQPYFTAEKSYDLDSSFNTDLFVHKNESVLPRAFFVREVMRVASADEGLKRLLITTNAPEEFAYSESEGKSSTEASASGIFNSATFNKEHSVSIVDYRSTVVSMKTDSLTDAYLVFSDSYYPGWKASIDGKDTTIIKVNSAMRAVKVPKGDHTIIWSYQPIAFYVGCGISFATLVTLVSYLGIEHLKKGRDSRGKVLHPLN